MDDLQKGWVRENAIDFVSGDPGSPLTDREQAAVDRIVKEAQVVAIGEAAHGSKTIIQSVQRILKFLIQERQADIIILEACLGATQTLNRYVAEGVGEAEQAVVATGGWNYANQESLGFVTWLRNSNQTPSRAKRPVRVFGCDCQSIDGPKRQLLRLLEEFVRTGALPQADAVETAALVTALPSDRDLYQFIELILREIDVKDPEHSRMADIEAWQSEFAATIPATLAKVTGRLQGVRHALPATVSNDDRFLFERFGRLLEQVVAFYGPGDAMQKRDAFMAENVLALRRHFQPERMLLLSHNLHVARTPILVRDYQLVSMGHHLARELGDDYRAIGSAFYCGQYLAHVEYRPEDDLVEDAHAPGPLAFESILQQVAADRQSRGLLFNLRKSDEQEPEFPSSKGMEMRLGEAGRQGSYEACFVSQRPELQYDGLLFLRESSPMTVLPGYYRQAMEQWHPSHAVETQC